MKLSQTDLKWRPSKEDLEWIETFYKDLEKMEGYVRPVDYIERATKVLRGQLTGKRRPLERPLKMQGD